MVLEPVGGSPPIQLRRRLSIDVPQTLPVPLEQPRAQAGAGAPGHPGTAGAPAGVDPDLVVDDPGLPVLDRGGGAGEQMTVVDGLEVDDLEAQN